MTPKETPLHILKTWPVYFDAIWSGEKTFEIRKNDRDFMPGDRLRLVEYDAEDGVASGDWIEAEVSYRMPGGRWGVSHEYCVMAIKPTGWHSEGNREAPTWDALAAKAGEVEGLRQALERSIGHLRKRDWFKLGDAFTRREVICGLSPRDVHAAIAILDAKPLAGSVAGGWQGMETAPRDGRWILLVTDIECATEARWKNDRWEDSAGMEVDWMESPDDRLFWGEYPKLPAPPEAK